MFSKNKFSLLNVIQDWHYNSSTTEEGQQSFLIRPTEHNFISTSYILTVVKIMEKCVQYVNNKNWRSHKSANLKSETNTEMGETHYWRQLLYNLEIARTVIDRPRQYSDPDVRAQIFCIIRQCNTILKYNRPLPRPCSPIERKTGGIRTGAMLTNDDKINDEWTKKENCRSFFWKLQRKLHQKPPQTMTFVFDCYVW